MTVIAVVMRHDLTVILFVIQSAEDENKNEVKVRARELSISKFFSLTTSLLFDIFTLH